MGKAGDQQYSFNLLFLKRFWRLHKIFFPGLCSMNVGLFVLLLLTSALEQILAYYVGLIAGQFLKVLGEKDWEGFMAAGWKNMLLIIGISITKSSRVLSTRILIVGWRQTLGHVLHKLYLTNNNYYRLNVLEGTLDNPDQRMTSDVSSLTEAYSSIISSIVLTPFTIAYYSYDAYSRAGWIGPTGMFGLFLISTVINKLLMKPVVQVTAEREQKEGDFRFKHLQVRCNAESLAFHGSSNFELNKINSKLSDLCGVQQKLYYRKFSIDVSVDLFSYLGAIASYLVIAVPIFAGHYDSLSGAELSQKISENSFVCMYLIYQMTQLVQITGTVAGMAGSTHRVCELIEELIRHQKSFGDDTPHTDDGTEPIIRVEESMRQESVSPNEISYSENEVLIEFCGFGLSPPSFQTDNPKILINDLNLQINRGRNVLLMGPSSSGKSSLLRAVRGLWKPTQGRVHINRLMSSQFFFLPQKPFFTNGTLREQINYPMLVVPEIITESQNKEILNLLDITGLSGLVERCGGLDEEPSWNWYDVLSPGEQQRLAFTRMYFHQPALAILDEATSAVSMDVEEILYKYCVENKITLLSVGHRSSLRQFHHQVLHLTGVDGGWRLEEIDAQSEERR